MELRQVAACPYCADYGASLVVDVRRLEAYRKAVNETELTLDAYGEPVGPPRAAMLNLRSCFRRSQLGQNGRSTDLFYRREQNQHRCNHLIELEARCDILRVQSPEPRVFKRRGWWQHPDLRASGFEGVDAQITKPRDFFRRLNPDIDLSIVRFCEWTKSGNRSEPAGAGRCLSGTIIYCECIAMLIAVCPELLQRPSSEHRSRSALGGPP